MQSSRVLANPNVGRHRPLTANHEHLTPQLLLSVNVLPIFI